MLVTVVLPARDYYRALFTTTKHSFAFVLVSNSSHFYLFLAFKS